eukprot:687825-Amphidinium_carterae.1
MGALCAKSSEESLIDASARNVVLQSGRRATSVMSGFRFESKEAGSPLLASATVSSNVLAEWAILVQMLGRHNCYCNQAVSDVSCCVNTRMFQ